MSELEYLEAENIELKERIRELEDDREELRHSLSKTGSPLRKEEAKLLGEIHKCKIELKQQNLKKTGYNSHNKYSYFELGDFLPCLERILDNHGLGSYCYFENFKGYLIIFDVASGVFHSWDTPCKIPHVKENGFDIGVHMKAEQAVQTYARRTLYLQAFDIVEPNSIEQEGRGDGAPVRKGLQRTKKQFSPVKPVLEKKDDEGEVTAERIQDILCQAEKQHTKQQLKKLEKDREPFTWTVAEPLIKDLCRNEREYHICKQATVFKTGDQL
jgi:cell division protein FtsB